MRRYLTYLLVGVSSLLSLLVVMAWVHCADNEYQVRWKEGTNKYHNQRFAVLGRRGIVLGSHLITAATTGHRGGKNDHHGGALFAMDSALWVSWTIEPDEEAKVEFEDESPEWSAFYTRYPEFQFPPGYFHDETDGRFWPRWGKQTDKELLDNPPAVIISHRKVFIFIPYWCPAVVFAVGPLWWLRGFLKRRGSRARGFSVQPVSVEKTGDGVA